MTLPYVDTAPACDITQMELTISTLISLVVIIVGLFIIMHGTISIQSYRFMHIGCFFRWIFYTNLISFLCCIILSGLSRYYCYQFTSTNNPISRFTPLALLFISLVAFVVQFISVESNLLSQLHHTFKATEWQVTKTKLSLWIVYYIVSFILSFIGIWLFFASYVWDYYINFFGEFKLKLLQLCIPILALSLLLLVGGHIVLARLFTSKLYKLIINTYNYQNENNNDTNIITSQSATTGNGTEYTESIQQSSMHNTLKTMCSITGSLQLPFQEREYVNLNESDPFNATQDNLMLTCSKLITINVSYIISMFIPSSAIIIFIGLSGYFSWFKSNIENLIVVHLVSFISLGNLIFIYFQYSFSDPLYDQLSCCTKINLYVKKRIMASKAQESSVQ